MIGAFAGSFDPPTVGHEDTIRRAAAVFEEVIVLVASNSLKHNLLEPGRRVELLKAICADLKNVRVELCPGLTVESAKAAGANVLIRSMRNPSDYEGEAANAWANTKLDPGMDTVFLLGDPAYSMISSTTVREFLKYHQSIESMVPRCVFEALQPELAHSQSANSDLQIG